MINDCEWQCLDAATWRDLPLLDLLPADEVLTAALPRQLGLGERSAIAAAVHAGLCWPPMTRQRGA